MPRPLYELTADVLYLADLFDEADTDAEVGPALDRWMAELEAEQATKLDSYLNLIRQTEMEATAAKAEKEQWAAKEKARTARAEYLKARLLRHLEATGQTKAVTATGRVVSVVKNGGVAPLAIRDGVEPFDVPTDYTKVTVDFNKNAIRAALEAGEELDFAELLPRGTSLRIK